MLMDFIRVPLLCVLLSLSSIQAIAQGYRLSVIVQDEDPQQIVINDLNNLGEVVGGHGAHTFRWRNGEFDDLNDRLLQGRAGFAQALVINDWSTIAGRRAINFQYEGVVLRRFSSVRRLQVDGNFDVVPRDINNHGHILVSPVAGSDPESFLLTASGVTPLGTTAGAISMIYAFRVNDFGVIAGNVLVDEGSRPVLWRNGVAKIAETPPELEGDVESCSGLDMNNRAQVVGWISSSFGARGFLWTGTGPVKVLAKRTTWEWEQSEANSINDWGLIVGSSTELGTEFVESKATLWWHEFVIDINELVDARDPSKKFVRLDRALFINNRGDIVARGADTRAPGVTAYYFLSFFRNGK